MRSSILQREIHSRNHKSVFPAEFLALSPSPSSLNVTRLLGDIRMPREKQFDRLLVSRWAIREQSFGHPRENWLYKKTFLKVRRKFPLFVVNALPFRMKFICQVIWQIIGSEVARKHRRLLHEIRIFGFHNTARPTFSVSPILSCLRDLMSQRRKG